MSEHLEGAVQELHPEAAGSDQAAGHTETIEHSQGHDTPGHEATPGSHESTSSGHAAAGHSTGHGDTGHAATAAHGEGEHHEGGGGIPELENAVDYYLLGKTGKDLHTIHNTVVVEVPIGDPHSYRNQKTLNWLDIINIGYAALAIVILVLVSLKVKSSLKKIPSGFQSLVELFVLWMDNYVKAIIGSHKGREQFLSTY